MLCFPGFYPEILPRLSPMFFPIFSSFVFSPMCKHGLPCHILFLYFLWVFIPVFSLCSPCALPMFSLCVPLFCFEVLPPPTSFLSYVLSSFPPIFSPMFSTMFFTMLFPCLFPSFCSYSVLALIFSDMVFLFFLPIFFTIV